jgi:hypothetical protein
MAAALTPTKKSPGRPRGARHASVTVWLPVSQTDRLIALARRHDRTVSATVRRAFVLALRDREP